MKQRYRTGSDSNRLEALNRLSSLSAGEILVRGLNVASGRYRSRFCTERLGAVSGPGRLQAAGQRVFADLI